jgi:hypothetical protein
MGTLSHRVKVSHKQATKMSASEIATVDPNAEAVEHGQMTSQLDRAPRAPETEPSTAPSSAVEPQEGAKVKEQEKEEDQERECDCEECRVRRGEQQWFDEEYYY